jgi:hypothetical protein
VPLKDVALSLAATPDQMAAVLCDALNAGAPVIYAETSDPALRSALCGALPRVGAARGLDIVARPVLGRVMAFRRPGSRKEVPHAA